jgi:hypothetical protein
MHRTLSDNKIVPDNSIEDVAARNWESHENTVGQRQRRSVEFEHR